MSSTRIAAFLLLAGLMGLPALPVGADDWPQWRGPDRSGVSKETGLLKEWPKGGPPLAWKTAGLGTGFATPSISNGRVYLLGGRKDNTEEYLIALNEKDGKEIWSTKIGRVGANRGQQYPAPRSTPAADGDRIYALSSDGDLVCVEAADGKLIWHKHLEKDFGGRRGNWAYAESPLIDGDVLVCTPGGSKATMVALNKKTGDVIWTASVPEGNEAAYSSIVMAQAGGTKQYVNFLSGSLVGISAKDGKLLWSYPKTANRIANIPTPLSGDGYVFSASGGGRGGGGGGLIQLVPEGQGIVPKEVFFSDRLGSHIGGFIRVGDYLYGTDNTQLKCVDYKTGEVKWQDRSVGKGSLTAAEGLLYVRGERGAVALVEATPAGYRERGRFDQPDRNPQYPAWPYPVIANGKLYLRDYDILLCYDIKAK